MIIKCEDCGCVLEIEDTRNPSRIAYDLGRHDWTTGYAFYNSDLECNDVNDIILCPKCFPEGLDIIECSSIPTEEQYNALIVNL